MPVTIDIRFLACTGYITSNYFIISTEHRYRMLAVVCPYMVLPCVGLIGCAVQLYTHVSVVVKILDLTARLSWIKWENLGIMRRQ